MVTTPGSSLDSLYNANKPCSASIIESLVSTSDSSKEGLYSIMEANKRMLGLDPNKSYLGIEGENEGDPSKRTDPSAQIQEQTPSRTNSEPSNRVQKLEEKVAGMDDKLTAILSALQK